MRTKADVEHLVACSDQNDDRFMKSFDIPYRLETDEALTLIVRVLTYLSNDIRLLDARLSVLETIDDSLKKLADYEELKNGPLIFPWKRGIDGKAKK